MSVGSSDGSFISSSPQAPQAELSILLVEDDVELCALMVDYFKQHGFRTETSHDGHTGLLRSLAEKFDVIILDAMLPVLDGFGLLRLLRKQSATPVIMLTARTAQKDRITGLNAGADDYLPKPFDPDELLARIRAVLRRAGTTKGVRPEVIEVGGLLLNAVSREVRYLTTSVAVTVVEFDILELLMRSCGRVVSRDELAIALYQRRSTPYERSLDVHISHLRKKIEYASGPVIQTIRGVGYRLNP